MHCSCDQRAYLLTKRLAASKPNKELHLIYGLVTDLTTFEFYSYDPVANKFFKEEDYIVENKRESFFSDMIHSMFIVP